MRPIGSIPFSASMRYLVYGVLVQIPVDPEEGLQLVDQAEALLSGHPMCAYCPTGYHVAAAMTCAMARQLERARDHLSLAERCAELWPPGPWRVALAEARGRLLIGEGAEAEAPSRCAGPPRGTRQRGSAFTSDGRAARWPSLPDAGQGSASGSSSSRRLRPS